MPPPHGPDESDAIRVPTSAVLSLGLRVFRHIYARCREIAHDEIVAYFREAWRGDKLQWQHQLPGHGYELTQHGTYTFTTSDIPVNTDTATHTVTYPLAYATGTTPDIVATAQDVGWIASVAPIPGNEHTQMALSLARRIPLTNPQTGTVSLTFPSGASSYVYPSNPVTFPNAYDSSVTPTPVVIPQTNHADFVAVASSVTTTGFTLTIYYRPNLSTGSVGTPSPNQSDDNATDSTGMHGVGTGLPVSPIETQLAYSKVAGANGSGGDGTTGNNSDGTDTGAASASNTGGENQTHVHHENGAGGNTNAESVGHVHDMSHTHPHNATGGTHDHPVPDAQHRHGMDDHVHNLNNHHHGLALHIHPFTGATTLTGSSVPLTIVWESFGQRAAPAVSKLCSWMAIGLQAS